MSDVSEKQRVRKKAAGFVFAREQLLRSIIRKRLSGVPGSVCDVDDVFATVIERVDRYALAGTLDQHSPEKLESFIVRIAINESISQQRLLKRLVKLRDQNGDYVHWLHQQVGNCQTEDETAELYARVLGAVEGTIQRQILILRLKGATHSAIASLLDLSPSVVRKQWSRMLIALPAILEARAHNTSHDTSHDPSQDTSHSTGNAHDCDPQ